MGKRKYEQKVYLEETGGSFIGKLLKIVLIGGGLLLAAGALL